EINLYPLESLKRPGLPLLVDLERATKRVKNKKEVENGDSEDQEMGDGSKTLKASFKEM
ncbi:hypothetical protein Golax_002317, partial [Gossypium laxum]|nr:hypothetical protein [Gossypium laxum]